MFLCLQPMGPRSSIHIAWRKRSYMGHIKVYCVWNKYVILWIESCVVMTGLCGNHWLD
jgi:hypothetical protein